MIGINYVGHDQGQLSGCHNDVMNMVSYIKNVHGFEDENITILMDDGEHTMPTMDNIIAAYRKLVAETEPNDALLCHYSGKLDDETCILYRRVENANPRYYPQVTVQTYRMTTETKKTATMKPLFQSITTRKGLFVMMICWTF